MSSQHIVVENEHSDIIEAFIKNNHPMVSHPSISNYYINDMLDFEFAEYLHNKRSFN